MSDSVKLHPHLIRNIISRHTGGRPPAYVGFVCRQEDLDRLEIRIRIDEEQFSDEIKELETFMHRLRGELEQSLGIPAKVRLIEPTTMSHYQEQLGLIVDERTNG